MRRILTTVAAIAFVLAVGIWACLLGFPPCEIAAFSEFVTRGLFLSTLLSLLAGATVLALGDRAGLQFFGAVAAVVAFVGLSAFYSTRTHQKRATDGGRGSKGAIAETQRR